VLDEAGAVLAFPAATATTGQLHFAIRYSSGLIHAAMPTSRLDELRVPDQPVLTSENSGTSFTVAVDATAGIGTGISAQDRAHTMRVLADPQTVADDLIRPGHVLPVPNEASSKSICSRQIVIRFESHVIAIMVPLTEK